MDIIDALVVTRPGELVIEKRLRPERHADEVLVAPRRAGICGTDYHIYEGNQPFLSYPRIMGHELAVDLVEAPEGSDLVIGDTYVVNPYVACGACIACRKGKPIAAQASECWAFIVMAAWRDC